MKSRLLLISIFVFVALNSFSVFSATVIKKEDAALFSKKSIYSEIDVQEHIVSNDTDEVGGLRDNDDALNKFTAVTATKSGDTYTNNWSNYTITLNKTHFNANDIYDFNADCIKYDFGVTFQDYSRLAVYYTRKSRDLNVICANFAPGCTPEDVEIAGAIYKHLTLDVPYPYGIEKYNYYLREIDGKLMVIETYHEDGYEIARKFIDEFEPAK